MPVTACRLDFTVPGRIVRNMHELGIASTALEQVLAQARLAGARQVTRIDLRVGVLSGVDADALHFAFAALLPGTAANGAIIAIDPVPAVAQCLDCQADFAPEDGYLCLCPRCGRPSTAFKQGRELELSRLEIL